MTFQNMLIVALLLSAADSCAAQGLRISTQIFSRSNDVGEDEVVGSSLTLCHSGRVYDYVAAADELVIYDPVGKRCRLLNFTRGLVTTVTFDEIRHQMEHRVRRTNAVLTEISSSAADAQTVENLRFQLQPSFSEKFSAADGVMTLTAKHLSYRVKTRQWENPEQIAEYLEYRDWAAQLNSVLHPGSLFPESRMAVNESLRKLSRVPVSVELQHHQPPGIRLRAEHRFTKGLTPEDQTRIARWEQMQERGQMKDVPLLRYQQEVLISGNP